MDSRRDFTSKKVFPGYFPELSEKANSGLVERAKILKNSRIGVAAVVMRLL